MARILSLTLQNDGDAKLVMVLKKNRNWKHLHLLILLSTILIGAFLRLYRLERLMWWWQSGDHGRDLLVAKHIADYGEIIFSGPSSFGGIGLLKNSVFYYYFLSFFWSLAHSAKGVVFFFSLLNIATIFIVYVITAKLRNQKAGLIAALLMSLSYRAIVFSRSVYQPFLLPLFISLYLASLLYSLKEKSFFSLTISTVLIFLSLQFHYSTLLFLPAFAFWTIYGLKVINDKSKKFILKFVFFIFLCFFLVLSWLFFSYHSLNVIKVLKKIILFLELSTQGNKNLIDFLLNSVGHLSIYFSDLFNFPFLRDHWRFSPFVIFILGGLVYSLIKNLSKKKNPFPIIFLCSFLSGILLSGLYTSEVLSFYFIPFLPVIFITLGYLFESLFPKKQILKLTMIVIFIIALSFHNARFFGDNSPNEFIHARLTSEAILKDYKKSASTYENPINKYAFDIYVAVPYDEGNWNSPMFWYFLEKEAKEPLIAIYEEGNNIKPLNNHPRYLYFICKSYLLFEQNIKKECLEKFLSSQGDWSLESKKPIFDGTITAEEIDAVVYKLERI